MQILDKKIQYCVAVRPFNITFRSRKLVCNHIMINKKTALHVITNHSYYPITLHFKKSNDMQGGKLYTTLLNEYGSPVFYLRFNLLNIKVPTISAADKINPRQDKFRSCGKIKADPINIDDDMILIGRTFELPFSLFVVL